MPDLDYAKVIGRFGLNVGDTSDDVDANPDTVWCDSGRVFLTPLNTFVKVAGGTPDPFTMAGAVIECAIDDDGYLTYDPPGAAPVTQFVWVVDLTSTKVNPQIADGKATHKVTFSDVMAGDTRVDFPAIDVRITAAGDGVSPDNMNDITILAPVVSGAPTPIYRGVQGVGIADASITGGTNLELELTDGTLVDAGALPVGPGGSDAGVAGYIGTPGSDTETALSASYGGAGRSVADPEFGAIGDFDGTSGHDNSDAFDDLIASGSGLGMIPRGRYYLSRDLVIDRTFELRPIGDSGDNNSGRQVQLVFASGKGIKVKQTTHGRPDVRIGRINVVSLTSGSLSGNYGLHITDGQDGYYELSVDGFGDHGIFVDSTGGGLCNLNTFDRVRITGPRGDGIRVEGDDCNVTRLIRVNVVGAWGWGINLEHVGKCVVDNPHLDQQYNGSPGACRDNGGSNRWDTVYSEVGIGMLIDTDSTYVTVLGLGLFGDPVITDASAAKTGLILDAVNGFHQRVMIKGGAGARLRFDVDVYGGGIGRMTHLDADDTPHDVFLTQPATDSIYVATRLAALADNTKDLGGAGQRWRDVYAGRYLRLGSLYLRDNSGTLEKSTDGSSWSAV